MRFSKKAVTIFVVGLLCFSLLFSSVSFAADTAASTATDAKLKVVKVTASHEADPAGAPVTKLIDGDITEASYWTSDKNNVTADFDLGKVQMITNVKMAFYNVNSQQGKFDLAVSSDGKKFTIVSLSNLSELKNANLQTYKVGKAARYLRVIGHGNTSEKWYMFTSITEVEIYGTEIKASSGTKLKVVKVTASHEADPAAAPATKLIDGDITEASYFTSDKNNVTIDFDLGNSYSMTEAKMAFYNVNNQQGKFDLAVSADGKKWTTVSTNNLSELKNANLQSFPINKVGRFLRVIGHGNTSEKWYMFTSITEVEIYGTAAKAPSGTKLKVVKVTASHEADPAAAPAKKLIDGDITEASYFTSDKNNVTIDFDLGKSYSITEVKMAFYNVNNQQGKFDLAVSADGKKWTTVSTKNLSELKNANLQSFPVNKAGRFLRVIGHGNTSEKWYMFTSITEVEIYGK